MASVTTYTSCRLSFGVELLGRFVESLVEMHTTQFRKFRLLGKSRKGSQTLEMCGRSGGAEILGALKFRLVRYRIKRATLIQTSNNVVAE